MISRACGNPEFRRFHFKIFLIYSSGGHLVLQSRSSRGNYEEHLFEIILNSD